MAAKKPKRTRWHAQTQLVKKARTDAAFRQKLVRNPNAAIKEALGITVPKGVTVEVVQEKPNKLYVVLPIDPKDVELPEGMLKMKAGVRCSWCVVTCGCSYGGRE